MKTLMKNTLSVGVSSPPARLKSVGKSRYFLTWAALLTTLEVIHNVEDFMVVIDNQPFVDLIQSILDGGSHFYAVLFNNLKIIHDSYHENQIVVVNFLDMIHW